MDGLQLVYKQWGVCQTADQFITVTFPVAFSSACYSITGTNKVPQTAGTDNWVFSFRIRQYSKTNFEMLSNSQYDATTNPVVAFWISIGV